MFAFPWLYLAWCLGRIGAFPRDCPGNSMAQYKMELRGTWTDSPDSNARLLRDRGFPDHWRWATGIGKLMKALT